MDVHAKLAAERGVARWSDWCTRPSCAVCCAERGTPMREPRRNVNGSFRCDELRATELLGIAVHDLRNPLGVISGFASAALDGVGVWPEEDLRDALRRIQAASAHMASLVEDMLELSAVGGDTLEIERDGVDARTFLAERLATCKRLASAKPVDLFIHVEDDLPELLIDAHRFERALDNVVANAIKYSDPGRRVWLDVRRASVGEVVFAVRDEGRGIAETFLPQLFEPFARERRVGTRHEKGTGLGLTIVREIIRAHGGRVAVSSQLGIGSTFELVVPAVPVAPEASERVVAA